MTAPKRPAFFTRPERRPGVKIEHLDLRSVTRDADRFVCEIRLDTGDYSAGSSLKTWITCGRIDVRFPDRRGARPATLSARANHGVTDFEHDSAYIFQIPITGWDVSFVSNGMVYAECVIVGDADDLRVPTKPGYDPTKLEGAYACEDKHCDKPHGVVPEGYFAGPPTSETVWRNLVGRRLEIIFGPTRKDDSDD